ncbi:unnamed protein product [Adineta ricciae]|uniref:Uncharacterized protein n=2 Tax=Adineta ricciae TaxID=249248 RepID=A0A815G6Q7_ADIRI|nr:unnamed protein product [Adineta ricciae]
MENLFSLAYHHKHDSIVLSTFACEVNNNPVDHIVQLFSSVIEQYAGFFKSITFAIPHSQTLFETFEKLDGTVNATKLIRKSNTNFGPYRIISEDVRVNDLNICDLPPCQFGGRCHERNNQVHTEHFSHPPLCPKACLNGKCDETKDLVHLYSFIHRIRCQYGGECRQIDDEKHCQSYDHPSYCSKESSCENMEAIHLREYRHLPLCQYSHNCMELRKKNVHHMKSFRHCPLICPRKNNCADFHDRKHLSELQHPFSRPCPFTPYNCRLHNELIQASESNKPSQIAQTHCLDYSHVCRFGRHCRDQTPLHLQNSIHVARVLCSDGDECTKLNEEEHLNLFTHQNILDIRLVCRHSNQCHDRHKLEHVKKFRHQLTSDENGVVQYVGLNKTIDFVRNHAEAVERVNEYVESEGWETLPLGTIPDDILSYIRHVQPVHRCNPVIFESIILHGHVMSRSYMEKLRIPKFVANSVLQHSRVRRIPNLSTAEDKARAYVIALVKDEFEKNGFPPKDTTTPAAASIATAFPTVTTLASEITMSENRVSALLGKNDTDVLKRVAIEIAQASIKLHANPLGIGYEVDMKLGTDRTIFSVLGPHLGHYYGDIVIVFKREILHHPDAEFTIQAGTSFHSAKAFNWRPWLGDVLTDVNERIKLFHASKLHASVPGYDYAAALELMAITSSILDKKSMNISLQDILTRWIQVDSHQTVEAHLPQLIPLDYIDHIYLPQNIYDMLNEATQKSMKAVFRNRVTITSHEGTDKPGFGFGPVPAEPARVEYQKYLTQELSSKFRKHIDTPLPRSIQGTIITIPSTHFDQHYVLPLTISQAYQQYCSDHSPLSDITIFIYWQAMRGDMMLTLANEQINLQTTQTNLSCLVCYVAEIPEVETNNYHEHHSYLNNDKPFSHDLLAKNHKYAAGSDNFYVGCNTGDFLTFCLQLHLSTGKVTLSHAGANSIYNHDKIVHTFNKSHLDLSALEYVHVSAGAHTVPIRNVMICFEKQHELHPTYDMEFSSSSELVDGSLSSISSLSSLIPCGDNVNCLLQLSLSEKEHNSKFSHPCRFSELCRNREPNLTHEPHRVPTCQYDEKCKDLADPFHRASYRHTGYPDYLLPCRHQQKCEDTSDKHRIKYSHGEQVFVTKEASVSHESSDSCDDEDLIPCKWGTKCRDIGDERHCSKYSHPAVHKHADHQIPCKWGSNCRDMNDVQHCKKYSHPDPASSDEDSVASTIDTDTD